jgi:hypothetical protein
MVWKIAILWTLVWTAESVDAAEPRAVGCGVAPAASAGVEHDAIARASQPKFRGVFFNPNVKHPGMSGYPWPVFDPYDAEYRAQIREALRELAALPPADR